jgi:hypothetical protein
MKDVANFADWGDFTGSIGLAAHLEQQNEADANERNKNCRADF